MARYTFDSRLNREQPDCELCRIDRNGSKQCVRVSSDQLLCVALKASSWPCTVPPCSRACSSWVRHSISPGTGHLHKNPVFLGGLTKLGFYCALPAEPHRTDMECNRLPKVG